VDTTAASSTPAAEDIPEDSPAEDIAERVENILDVGNAAPASRTGHTRVPIPIVADALATITEHLVRLGRLLKEVDGFVISRMAVRMVPDGEFPIGARDLIV
jgi:hypothetical protein